MPYQDLREWFQQVESLGELKTLEGVNWDLEIGAIADVLFNREGSPAVLFDRVPGHEPGFRVMANALGSTPRLALTLGLPTDLPAVELVKAWREKIRTFRGIPPRVVKDGPVTENVMEGKDVNVLAFPAPRWFAEDGGRYIGTGSATITRDPDEGWVNLGTYRIMVHDEKTLGFYISPGKHGRIHRDKRFKSGEPLKVAVSIGHEPLVFLVASNEIPYGVSEYDYMGFVKGEPVEVIQSDLTGLPIPARAEIVVEGELDPKESRVEGPFGEWTGYYGSSARPEPVLHIKRIFYRNNPVIMGMTRRWRSPFRAALLWDELEKVGVPEVRGIWFHEEGGPRMLAAISIKQCYPGHARQVGFLASQVRTGAYLGRFVIVVDEDINPADLSEVLWAATTRCDPEKDIEILRRCWSGPLDPIIPRGEKGFSSRAIIDACRPYEWKEDFPHPCRPPLELRQAMVAKYGKEIFG